MGDVKVPYLPVTEFDPSVVLSKFSDTEHRDDDLIEEKFDLNSFIGNEFSKEVGLILLGMGMGKYIELFKEVNIGVDTFLNLNDADLQEIGITDPQDREIITKDLKFHTQDSNELIIMEDHTEDLRIIQNVSHQLLLLQHYCAFVELQLRKQTLVDYTVEGEDSACTFLKAFAECALTQSKIISKRIYNENNSEGLINKLLQAYNVTLSQDMHSSFSKKKRKNIILKIVAFIGFSSVCILTGRYLIQKT